MTRTKPPSGLLTLDGTLVSCTNGRDRTAGITLRKRFNRSGEAFMWMEPGDPKEIAAQLRRAAAYLEEQTDD